MGRRHRRRLEYNIKMDLQFRRFCVNILKVDKQKLLRILSVFVALGVQHAMHMRRIILLSVASMAPRYFSTFSHKRHDFRKKKLLNIQCVFNLPYNFCLKYFSF